MADSMQDEVVSERTAKPSAGGLAARPVVHETVDAGTGTVKVVKSGVEEETMKDAGRKGRAFKESTMKLLEKFEQEEKVAPAHDEGDVDEDEPADDTDAPADPDDEGLVDEGAAAGEGEAPKEGETAEKPVVDEWQTKAATLEARNRDLVNELETARKTPKAQRTERENTLLAAEAAYVDEGSIPAIRKFLSVVTGAAPDSKEVDAELSGILTDLTARELGVALDQNQRTLRDNARTRLLLGRDKREKVEREKQPVAGNGADDVQYEQATQYVSNQLTTKGQSGTSIADEHPMLMALTQDFDHYTPAEVIARAIKHEIEVGTLDPTRHTDADMIRYVAGKAEKHYEAVAKKIEAARSKQTKTDTTKPSVQPKVAAKASTEQRQSPEARTITNATASRAPAKPPKTTKQKESTSTAKTRKDFPSESAWKEHLLAKHFPS